MTPETKTPILGEAPCGVLLRIYVVSRLWPKAPLRHGLLNRGGLLSQLGQVLLDRKNKERLSEADWVSDKS